MEEELSGVVGKILFRADNGWGVLSLHQGDGPWTRVTGLIDGLNVGDRLRVRGQWQEHDRYGRQLQAHCLEKVHEDVLRDGWVRFFALPAFKGIGAQTAERLVAALGADPFQALSQGAMPSAVLTCLTARQRRALAAGWRSLGPHSQALALLLGAGLGERRALRTVEELGPQARELILTNPYMLIDWIDGVGFTTADHLALGLGLPPDAPLRTTAALHHWLGEHTRAGHCGMPVSELVETLTGQPPLAAEAIEQQIRQQVAQGQLALTRLQGVEHVFPLTLFNAESRLAGRLLELTQQRPPWPWQRGEELLERARERAGVQQLTRGQLQALEGLFAHRLGVLTGGPGTGKTTLLRGLLGALRQMVPDLAVALGAPTGRAAQRLSQATGLPAATLHRLLAERDEQTTLSQADLVVVDETSMLDVPLAQRLLEALPEGAALILVGDPDQLPSIGPGSVLGDIVRAGSLPLQALDEIQRQAQDSGIVRAAHHIRRGHLPELEDEEFQFLTVEPEEDETTADHHERVWQTLRLLVVDNLAAVEGFDLLQDLQVLTPMRKGPLGTERLNRELQALLNPGPAPQLPLGEQQLRLGDKVMQIRNDHTQRVYNGDLGRVVAVEEAGDWLEVEFAGRTLTYQGEERQRLELAYAQTVHKAQGGETGFVVMPLVKSHYPLLERALVYTAVTRAQAMVLLVGEREALQWAVGRARGARRVTRLGELLSGRQSPRIIDRPAGSGYLELCEAMAQRIGVS